jgi:hypothetical protein
MVFHFWVIREKTDLSLAPENLLRLGSHDILSFHVYVNHPLRLSLLLNKLVELLLAAVSRDVEKRES